MSFSSSLHQSDAPPPPCYRLTFLLKATEEKINECKHGLVDGAVRERERERDGVTIYPHQRLGPHLGGSTLPGEVLG